MIGWLPRRAAFSLTRAPMSSLPLPPLQPALRQSDAAWRWAVLAMLLLGVAWAALTPADRAPLLFWPDGRPVSDKVLHAAAFAVLGCAAGVLVRPALLVLVGLMMFGVGVEALQAIGGAGRHGDLRDIFANMLGLGAAAACVMTARWMGGAPRALPAGRMVAGRALGLRGDGASRLRAGAAGED